MAEQTWNEGDRIQVIDRDATADDVKSQLFYNHFRGLIGRIQKVYPGDEIAVEVELESLPEPVLQRHSDVQQQMKNKWLDGLSEEARNRLTDREKDFRLHYTMLVKAADLERADGRIAAPRPTPVLEEAPRPARIMSAQEEAAPAPTRAEAVEEPAPAPSARQTPSEATSQARLTLDELDAAEEAEIARRQAG